MLTLRSTVTEVQQAAEAAWLSYRLGQAQLLRPVPLDRELFIAGWKQGMNEALDIIKREIPR